MQPSRADFGLAIMIYLKLADMTQTELAQQSGVSDRTLSDWKTESDRRIPSRKLLEQVAVPLRVTVADIYATANYLADLRIRREAAISTPKQLFLEPRLAVDVQEVSELRSLSKEQLIVELGRARDRQLEIEAELAARRPPEGRG
jgi:transcriptional regulator with XRE-family HTH domain